MKKELEKKNEKKKVRGERKEKMAYGFVDVE